MYKLRTIYDNRKSFYGKATVNEEKGILTLKSYQTNVAHINLNTNTAYVKGAYSQTTLRHIKDFLLQNGFKANNSKQILKDYEKDCRPNSSKQPDNPLKQQFKSVSMVCSLGSIVCNTQAEKNAWNKKMLNTIHGINFPDDFDSLPEKEQTRRLEGALEQIKS